MTPNQTPNQTPNPLISFFTEMANAYIGTLDPVAKACVGSVAQAQVNELQSQLANVDALNRRIEELEERVAVAESNSVRD